MIIHPQIDPVAFRFFGWPVYWYGVMYLLAFFWFFFIGQRLLQTPTFAYLRRRIIMEDFTTAGLLGVIIGGRMGYVLFYNPTFYAAHPMQIFYLWDGGMSFHGGFVGVTLAMLAYARLSGNSFLRLTDFAAVLTPVGLGLGRIGNFINGELPGRLASSDLPWAMIFPHIDSSYRHPSPIYQALLEGVVLAVVMLLLARRRRKLGFLSGAFLIGYGLVRLFSEYFREPDAHIGFLIGELTMGQLLSLPMLVLGIGIIFNQRISQLLCFMVRKKNTVTTSDWHNHEPAISAKKTQSFSKLLHTVIKPASQPTSLSDEWESIENDGAGIVETADDWDAPQPQKNNQTENAASRSWWENFFSDKGEDKEDGDEDMRIPRRYKRRLRKKYRR